MGRLCGGLAAAVVIVVAATAAAQVVAIAVAAAAEQQDQDDDPPAVVATKTKVTHKRYLQKKICYGLRRTFHVIPPAQKGAVDFFPDTVFALRIASVRCWWMGFGLWKNRIEINIMRL